MTPTEFSAILSKATASQLEALDASHWRYMTLIGIVDGEVSDEVAAADRGAHPLLVKKGDNGLPIFSDADCVAFMTAITGLSAEFCAAWRDKDFYDLHGESGEEMAARLNAEPRHTEALRLLSDGLCCIREAALVAPEHACKVADALHNIPGILAGEDRAGDSYLIELIEKGRSLINDRSWR